MWNKPSRVERGGGARAGRRTLRLGGGLFLLDLRLRRRLGVAVVHLEADGACGEARGVHQAQEERDRVVRRECVGVRLLGRLQRAHGDGGRRDDRTAAQVHSSVADEKRAVRAGDAVHRDAFELLQTDDGGPQAPPLLGRQRERH